MAAFMGDSRCGSVLLCLCDKVANGLNNDPGGAVDLDLFNSEVQAAMRVAAAPEEEKVLDLFLAQVMTLRVRRRGPVRGRAPGAGTGRALA